MFSRLASRTVKTGRRFMAGGGHGHGHEEERTGIDKVIRGVFKEDHQLSMAILGLYGFLGFVAAKWPKSKKAVTAPPAHAPAHVESSHSDIPDFDSPAFEAWANTEGNLEKWISKMA